MGCSTGKVSQSIEAKDQQQQLSQNENDKHQDLDEDKTP